LGEARVEKRLHARADERWHNGGQRWWLMSGRGARGYLKARLREDEGAGEEISFAEAGGSFLRRCSSSSGRPAVMARAAAWRARAASKREREAVVGGVGDAWRDAGQLAARECHTRF